MTDITDLIGKTLVRITDSNEEIIFECKGGKKYKLYHSQNCCENVYVDDICGDLPDLLGSPITVAEECSGEIPPDPGYYESITWTFYKIDTIHAGVTIRWCGQSNGYYSESVDFDEVG